MVLGMGFMSVTNLLKQSGEFHVPVDPLSVASHLNIEVYETDFTLEDGENVSGIVAVEDGQPVIYVSTRDPHVRKRFTIAHEIGHVYLGHLADKENNELIDDEVRLRSATWNLEEKEANEFAARLLMPASLIRGAIDRGRVSIEELAEFFDVSEQAMMYRLKNLGY
ncbi:MAG: ImmA/IrrE family metallo-endopeptidase [Synergistaceae bacterium]|nr:ImmA/IrrE family metallo-endopeptidase [Synergistaceae bacterium]